MLEHFRLADQKHGVNTVLYEDPQYTALADKEVLENFNREL